MAYIINKYDGNQLAVVEDGTLDQTTDLKLVGKNYAGYGEIQNENFIFLLENFAGKNEPPKAINGQLWFDVGESKLKFYDGNQWRTTGGAEVSSTKPSGLAPGDFWWDTTNEQLWAYSGTEFILVGPQGAGDLVTRFESAEITDTSVPPVSHSVILSRVDNEVVHIIANETFVINDDNEIQGFSIIRPGLNLTNSSTGQTENSNARFHGTATNAEKLDGKSASDFISVLDAGFTSLVRFRSDSGLTIGASDDIAIKVVSDNYAEIANEQGNDIYFNVKDENGEIKSPFTVNAQGIFPGRTSPTNPLSTIRDVTVGNSNAPFFAMYATTFHGKSTSSDSLYFSNENRYPSTSAAANTVAVRDANGNLTANLFEGVASQAKYADLAEKYIADKDYEPGTVVCIGGEQEITATMKETDPVVGVVSTNPAYLMNSESEGIPVALKGRVPCKVDGKCNKGDFLIPKYNMPGIAQVIPMGISAYTCIGIALEDKTDEGVGVIEVFVK
jgi:hypothetical protein